MLNFAVRDVMNSGVVRIDDMDDQMRGTDGQGSEAIHGAIDKGLFMGPYCDAASTCRFA